MFVFFHTKCVSKMGRVRSPKRRVRDDDFMVGSWSESVRIVFLLAEAIHGVSAEILNLQISWQAQYLVRFEICLLCALEMTFHMRRGLIMSFILRGRRSIW